MNTWHTCSGCSRGPVMERLFGHTCAGSIVNPGVVIICQCPCNQPSENWVPPVMNVNGIPQ